MYTSLRHPPAGDRARRGTAFDIATPHKFRLQTVKIAI
jgi:hypothetical protein